MDGWMDGWMGKLRDFNNLIGFYLDEPGSYHMQAMKHIHSKLKAHRANVNWNPSSPIQANQSTYVCMT